MITYTITINPEGYNIAGSNITDTLTTSMPSGWSEVSSSVKVGNQSYANLQAALDAINQQLANNSTVTDTFVITYQVKADLSADHDKKIDNTAKITPPTGYPSQDTTTFEEQDVVAKTGQLSNGMAKWIVTINPDRLSTSGWTLSDVVSQGNLVSDPAPTITVNGGTAQTISASSVDDLMNQVLQNYMNGRSDTLVLTYYTDGLSMGDTVTNTVKVNEQTKTATVTIDPEQIRKSANGYTAIDGGYAIHWTTTMPMNGKTIPEGATLTDTYYSGDHTSELGSNSTKATMTIDGLTEGVDYSLVMNEKGYTITFLKDIPASTFSGGSLVITYDSFTTATGEFKNRVELTVGEKTVTAEATQIIPPETDSIYKIYTGDTESVDDLEWTIVVPIDADFIKPDNAGLYSFTVTENLPDYTTYLSTDFSATTDIVLSENNPWDYNLGVTVTTNGSKNRVTYTFTQGSRYVENYSDFIGKSIKFTMKAVADSDFWSHYADDATMHNKVTLTVNGTYKSEYDLPTTVTKKMVEDGVKKTAVSNSAGAVTFTAVLNAEGEMLNNGNALKVVDTTTMTGFYYA